MIDCKSFLIFLIICPWLYRITSQIKSDIKTVFQCPYFHTYLPILKKFYQYRMFKKILLFLSLSHTHTHTHTHTPSRIFHWFLCSVEFPNFRLLRRQHWKNVPTVKDDRRTRKGLEGYPLFSKMFLLFF